MKTLQLYPPPHFSKFHICAKIVFILAWTCLTVVSSGYAQGGSSIPGEWHYDPVDHAIKNTTVASSFVRPINPATRSVDIVVEYPQNNDPNTPNVPPAVMAAIDFAVDIWESSITSTQLIRIRATYEPLGFRVLGGARAVREFRDFATTDPAFQTGTLYASALADKLAETDLNPNRPDIEMTFTTSQTLLADLGIEWYFGTDLNPANNQVDFVSVVLHEIGHGLGFYSSARANSYGFADPLTGIAYPVIYDRFLVDNTGTSLTSLPIGVPSTAVANFVTCGCVEWNSGGYDIFSPNLFRQGSSISHFDEATYPAGDPNSLMTPDLGLDEAIHDAGPFGLDVLEDIGWELHVTTGIEDYISIASGPDLISGGASFSYDITFHDLPPYGDYPTSVDWQIEVLHTQGTYTAASGNTGYLTSWTSSFTTLPFGNEWLRNDDGSIRARLVVEATDNDNVVHKIDKNIGIRAVPGKPIVYLHPQSGNQATISYYAPGATNYEIYYDLNSGVPYSGIGLPQGNSPLSTNYETPIMTFTGLASNTTYYFNVRASNSFGTSAWGDEVSTAITCSNASNSFTLPSCRGVGQSIILNANNLDHDADPSSPHYVKIVGPSGTTYYSDYGSIGSFDLQDIETLKSRYFGPFQNFSTGNYDVTLYYYVCGSFYSLTESFDIHAYSYQCGVAIPPPGNGPTFRKGENPAITLSPNPASRHLLLSFAQKPEVETTATMFTISGQRLKSWNLSPDTQGAKLSVADFPAGLYLMRIESPTEVLLQQKVSIIR